MNTKHTPFPWESRPLYRTNDTLSGIFRVAQLPTSRTSKRLDDGAGGFEHADAAFIVRACNAHDELVAALEMTLQTFNNPDYDPMTDDPIIAFAVIEKARAALVKAKGKA